MVKFVNDPHCKYLGPWKKFRPQDSKNTAGQFFIQSFCLWVIYLEWHSFEHLNDSICHIFHCLFLTGYFPSNRLFTPSGFPSLCAFIYHIHCLCRGRSETEHQECSSTFSLHRMYSGTWKLELEHLQCRQAFLKANFQVIFIEMAEWLHRGSLTG